MRHLPWRTETVTVASCLRHGLFLTLASSPLGLAYTFDSTILGFPLPFYDSYGPPLYDPQNVVLLACLVVDVFVWAGVLGSLHFACTLFRIEHTRYRALLYAIVSIGFVIWYVLVLVPRARQPFIYRIF